MKEERVTDRLQTLSDPSTGFVWGKDSDTVSVWEITWCFQVDSLLRYFVSNPGTDLPSYVFDIEI